MSCPAAHACFDGLCEPTGCLPLGCPYEGEVCLDRICQPDPCELVTCDTNEVCTLGECQADPCLGVECPQYQRCAVVLGTAQCVADWPIIDEEPQPVDMGTEIMPEMDSGSAGPDMGTDPEFSDLGAVDVERPADPVKDESCDALTARRHPPVTLLLLLLGLLWRRARSEEV